MVVTKQTNKEFLDGLTQQDKSVSRGVSMPESYWEGLNKISTEKNIPLSTIVAGLVKSFLEEQKN